MINKCIKILLIEDNPGDARLIREILSQAHDVVFDITWATYLDKGLGHLSSESFDGILLDLSLQDSFGIETFVKLKKQAPQIPILILTGLNDESLALKAVREGAQDYLMKGQLSCCNLLIHALRYAIERNNIERALKDMERQYRTTINAMGDAIYVVDKNLRFILFNKSFKQWIKRLDLTTDLIGKTIFEVFPFLPDKVREEYCQVFESRKTLIINEYYKFGDEEFITETRKIPVFENGRVARVVTIIRDMTKQKKDEKALHYSREKYSNLFQHSNDQIIMHDVEGHIIDANQKVLDHFGYTLSEMLSLTIADLHPAGALERSGEAFRKISQDGFVRFEIDFKKKSGDIFPAEVSSSLFEVEGKPIIQGIVRDITERKKAENDIRDSEAKFRALSENSPNMIFMNKQGRVVYANKRCEEIMGYKKEEYYSPDFDILCLIAPEYRGIVMENFKRHLQGEEVAPFEYINITKEGKRIESMLTTKLIDYEGDKAILGIVTDITNLKEAERVLKRDRETFEKLVDEKTKELVKIQIKLSEAKRLSDIGLLAATVAHELRNPLAVIKMACFNIRQKRINPTIDRNLENIEDRLSESNQIINNLLFYSRIKIPHFENIDIYHVLEVCISEVNLRLHKKRGMICKNWGISDRYIIEADPLQIKELFINILNNACDAVREPYGEIEVGVKSDSNGFIHIYVKDNGSGISAEDLTMVYDPFFSTKSNGTGLGLTICFQIVKLHDGCIKIISEKEKGTTAKVKLPIKRSTPSPC
ncbi:MAG: PAS domain S-box protein [bacterium]